MAEVNWNDVVINYLKNNGSKEVNSERFDELSDDIDAVAEMGFSAAGQNVSLFEVKEDMSDMAVDDFVNDYLKQIPQVEGSSVTDEQLALFADILDQNGDNKLSYDELKLISKDGFVSSDSLFFSSYGEADSEEALEGYKPDGSSSDTGSDGTVGGGDDGVTPPSGGEQTPPAGLGDGGDGTPAQNPATADVGDATLNELRALLYDIVTESDTDDFANAASVIDFWKNNPKAIQDIIPEGADINQVLEDLRGTYIRYSEEDEKEISAYMKLAGCTRAEAIEANKSKLGKPISDDKTNIDEIKANSYSEGDASQLGDAQVKTIVAALYSATEGKLGTDEDVVSNYLLSGNYNSADIVKIMKAYEEKYGHSLMSAIQGDYSGGAETELRNVLYDASMAEALKASGWNTVEDIPGDVVDSAIEYYQAFQKSDATGYMSKFDKLPADQKAQIIMACQILYPDFDLMNELTEDRVWFGAEDKYVDNILNALIDE
ncbi:MAG: annexin [Cyanobacteria bacterium SIG29]|nr:annexin [Cyanobacteria bacterium SIG29]